MARTSVTTWFSGLALLAHVACSATGTTQTQPSPTTDVTHSTLSTDGVAVLADGLSYAPVTVTVVDPQGQPVVNANVTVVAGGCAVQQSGSPSDANGQSVAWVTCNQAGQVTAAAIVNIGSSNTILTSTVALTFFSAPTVGFLSVQMQSQLSVSQSTDVTISALDGNHQALVTYVGTVTFSSTDSTAAVPLPYQFTVADAGTVTLPAAVAFNSMGSWSLTVQDANSAAVKATASAQVSGLPFLYGLNTSACLDTSGTGVVVAWCNGAASQQWQFSNGQLRRNDGMCLDSTGTTTPNTPLQINACSSTAGGQQWYYDSTYDRLIQATAGLCADTTGFSAHTGTVTVNTCNTQANQAWVRPTAHVLQAGSDSTKCLEVAAGGEPTRGDSVDIGACADSAAQQWTVVNQQVRSNGGLCLDGANATGVGGALLVNPCSNSNTQGWAYSPATLQLTWVNDTSQCLTQSPTLTLAPCLASNDANLARQQWMQARPLRPSLDPSLCMDTVGQSTLDGTQLTLSTCDASATQLWQFVNGQLRTANGACMHYTDSSTPVGIAACANNTTENWAFRASFHNITHIVNNGCVGTAATAGATVTFSGCNQVQAQLWQ